MKRLSSLIIMFGIAVLLAGCQTQPPRGRGLQGPQLSLPDLVQKINANNQQLPTLWTRINLEADIRNPDTGKRRSVYADSGYLYYRSPDELRLVANKDIAGLLLDLGINHERYWLIAPEPGPDMMWWGYTQAEPQQSEIPLRPQDMLQILAIQPIALSGPDVPTLRYSAKDQAYILIWYRKVNGQYTVSREIFYDQESFRPKTVLLFGTDSSLVAKAQLSSYADVDSPSKPKPQIAREYEVLLPQSRSWARLRLVDDMTISHKGTPNDRNFQFPPTRIVSKEKQIDAQVSK